MYTTVKFLSALVIVIFVRIIHWKTKKLTIFLLASLMHSGLMSFKSFSVGIWQSHPLQHHTPGLIVYFKKHVNYQVQTPTEGGVLAQSGPPLHLGSWIWGETPPDHRRQIKDQSISIIIHFIIIIGIITKLRQSYYKLRQLLQITTIITRYDRTVVYHI